MKIEVKVPQLPESISEATLVAWHRKPGDAVKRDENLIDIETDKVVLELPAPADGVLAEIAQPDGATVTSNQVIAVIDTEAKAVQPAVPAGALAEPAPAPAPAAATAPSAAAAAAPPSGAPGALPAARKVIAEAGLDPATIAGSGRGGRITKGDALAAAAGAAPSAAAPAAAPQRAPAAPAAPAMRA
ncbi:MAG: E3 binding domain-containing protein, partial [Proteobacteria bacterium]|nr:E3 binding domain-containing protein [Pseudomonadota bacterium]